MPLNVSSAAQIINWNRRILDFLGSWPEDPRKLRFSVFLCYLSVHVTLEYIYLWQNIRKLESVVAGFTENIPFTIVLLKTVIFHKNTNLICKIILVMKKNLAAQDYRSEEEVEIFLKYNAMAKNFVRIVVPLIFLSSLVYFAKPLFIQFTTTEDNTFIFDLPYRVSLFYDITDVRSYALTYVLQTPMVLIATFGFAGTDCLMATLTLHVCGELSILAIRIKKLNCNTRGSHEAIRILINKHVQLIRIARKIEDVFNVLLLSELFGSTFLICFLGYNVLANTTGGQETDLLNFSLYGFSVIVLLYIFCYIGDCLTHESMKVTAAFFDCSWYDLPVKNSKSFVTCIIQSQKPLNLTAGKFYVFSLETFADVMKTSMAYLSVLRTFL